MPERDYGLGGREAREAYDSAKDSVKSKPTVRPRARPKKNDPPPVRPRARPIEEAETISVKESDTDALVGMWDAVTGNFTPSEESSLGREVIRQIEKDAPKDSPSISLPSKPALNLGPASLNEKGISLDWANVFESLLKDKLPNNVRVNKLKSSWDGGDTIKLLDANFTFAEGGKVSDQAQTEMELIMNEQQDPVSGNTAPIGAKPSEVRDDIDVRVSEGEFIINAQTVRYFGEDFFNELQNAAAEGFDRIKEGDELPFRDDELDVEEEEMPQGFAEGGVVPEPVGGGYGQYGGTGARFSGFQSKQYINDDTKQKMVVFFFNGRPLSRIPKGFREMGETVVEEQQEAEAVQEVRSPADDRNTVALEEIKKGKVDWKKKNPKDWGMDEFKQYNNSLVLDVKEGANPLGLDQGEKLVSGLLGGGVLGKIVGGGSNIIETMIKKSKEKRSQEILDRSNEILSSVDFIRNENGVIVDRATRQPLPKEQTDLLNTAGVTSESTYLALSINNALKDKQKEDRGIISEITSSLGVGSNDAYKEMVEEMYNKGLVATPGGRELSGTDYLDPYDDPLGIANEGYEDMLGLSNRLDRLGLAEEVTEERQKYDPRDASMSGGAKKNLLTEKDQESFNYAVETGNDTLAAHYVQINKLRNKKESFAEQYDSASEDEKDRLISADRVDGLSTQDREQAIKKSSSSSNKESFHDSLVRKARETKEKNKAAGLGAQTKAGSMAGTKSGFFD